MSILDPEALAASPLADLHALASELSIDGYRRLRKAELIDAILTRQGGESAPDEPATEPAEDEARPASRRRRRAPAREEPAEAPAEEPEAESAEDEERPAAHRRRGRRGGRGRGARSEEDGAAARE